MLLFKINTHIKKYFDDFLNGYSLAVTFADWLTGLIGGKRGAMDRTSDSEYMNDFRRGFESNWCQNLCDASCTPGQGTLLYNCSVVRRSRKAVGPVYMYLNINTSVHVKERHRLFVKSRGSSQYCWLYFKTTLIYSRFQSMGQGRLWPVWVPWPLGSKWNVGQYHRRRRSLSHSHTDFIALVPPLSVERT